jgi:ATP-binding cassette, subfamily B, bacterial
MAHPTSNQTLRIYLRHSLKYKRYFWRIILLVPIAVILADFLTAFMMSRILTQLANAQSDNAALTLEMFQPYLIGIIIAQAGQTLVWNFIVRGVWRLEENTMRDLAMHSFSHLVSMSQRFFNNRFGGSLVSQTNKFVSAYERIADTLIFNVYTLILGFIFTVILLAKPAPFYVLGLTVLTLSYVYAVYKVKQKELAFNKEWAQLQTKSTGQLADTITNMAAVKSFAHEDLETGLYQKRVDGVFDISMKTMSVTMRNELGTNAIQRVMEVTAVAVSVMLAIRGNGNVGLIYLILTYTISILRRLWDLNFVFRNLNRSFADASDMVEILAIDAEIKDPKRPETVRIHRGQIDFKDVVFEHGDGGAKIFNKLNFRLKPGEKVGLVGPSGSGKTTLTQLILRLMDIHKGEILIDGQNISKITQLDLREHIAYVPQEPLMFHRTIMENIRYGQLDASDEQVIAAAKMANAHEFIESLSHGYDTLVGERGTKLSGGQRQRVAIARAMLKNAPILILDEATSALDSESEVLIQDALWKLMEGRTAIVIAHRLSTIQKMDRIIVLENGEIVEQGSHRELLNQPGTYAKLWSHQSGGFIEE